MFEYTVSTAHLSGLQNFIKQQNECLLENSMGLTGVFGDKFIFIFMFHTFLSVHLWLFTSSSSFASLDPENSSICSTHKGVKLHFTKSISVTQLASQETLVNDSDYMQTRIMAGCTIPFYLCVL